jgi:hypothetical protein
MTIENTYTQFLILVNRNATNNNVNVDRYRFVKMFNDIQNRFLEWALDKRNEDSIRDVQVLLIPEQSLVLVDTKDNYQTFSLPENYFDYSNITAYASSECCKNEKMLVYEVKSEDVEEKLTDKYTEPSFDWRETFGYISSNTFTVFRNDFSVDKLLMTYYRYPRQVDIAGKLNEEGVQSTSIDPEFDDKVVGRLLLALAKEFSAINSDTTEYQLNKDRLFNI